MKNISSKELIKQDEEDLINGYKECKYNFVMYGVYLTTKDLKDECVIE